MWSFSWFFQGDGAEVLFALRSYCFVFCFPPKKWQMVPCTSIVWSIMMNCGHITFPTIHRKRVSPHTSIHPTQQSVLTASLWKEGNGCCLICLSWLTGRLVALGALKLTLLAAETTIWHSLAGAKDGDFELPGKASGTARRPGELLVMLLPEMFWCLDLGKNLFGDYLSCVVWGFLNESYFW